MKTVISVIAKTLNTYINKYELILFHGSKNMHYWMIKFTEKRYTK